MENSSNDKGPKPPAHMSAEEYKERRRVLDEYVEKYQNIRRDLDKLWCEQSPFQPGDKVRALYHGKWVAVFVKSVDRHGWLDGAYDYRFDKVKKDGTRANATASVYYPDKIELIAKATSNP